MFRRAISSAALSAAFFRHLTVVPMPALSPTMESGKIVEWKKKIGDKVAVGETYCSLETDKATAQFDNADDDMWMARIIAENGTQLSVGSPICLCVESEAELQSSKDEIDNWKPPAAAKPADSKPEEAKPAEKTPPAAAADPAASAPKPPGDVGHLAASPLARKIAKEIGVDLATVEGTGPRGRITKEDVEAASKRPTAPKGSAPAAAATGGGAPAAAPAVTPITPTAAAGDLYEDTPNSMMRRTIARRMTQSKNTEVPHYYLMNEAVADGMLSTIKALNAKGGGKYKISVNDFLVKAIGRANLIVPAANSQWSNDFVRHFKTVDVSVAVATPAGLITPVIKNVHAKGLAQISIEAKDLAKRARDGALQPSEYQGGTATISNLGGMDIPNFTAIINQPQAMILAVGTTSPRPEIVKNADDEYEMTGKIETVIKFTGSFDHRVVDGAVGAEWMKHFKDTIENPLSLLL